MSVSKELSIWQRIGAFIERNKDMKKSLIVKHFQLEGIPTRTIYDIIERINKGISLDRKPGSGHWHKISQKTKDKIIEENVREIASSYASIGRSHNIDDKTAKKILTEAGIQRKKELKRQNLMRIKLFDNKKVYKS
jgi:hypothetical protein